MSIETVPEQDERSNASGAGEDVSHSTDMESRAATTVKEARGESSTCCGVYTSGWWVLTMVVVVAAVAGAATFVYTSNNQEDEFEARVETFAHEISEASLKRSENLFRVLNTLAVSLSAYAKSSSTPWPFQTIPNFEYIVENYRTVAHSRFIATLPLVAHEQKQAWQNYSEAEQGWIKESYEALGISNLQPLPIHPTIYQFQGDLATESTQGPFMPLWQTSPPPRSTGVINYNLLSNQAFADTLQIALDNHQPMLSQVTDISVLVDDEPNTHESLVVHPIYIDSNVPESQVVGSIVASLSWDGFFSNLVRGANQGMLCVLKNSCGDALTYRINGGQASFVAMFDAHDPDYEDYRVITKLTPFIATDPESSPGYCEYELHIYPSERVEEDFVSKLPAIYTAAIIVVFVIMGFSFAFYDNLVHKRQQEAQDQAARSDAIVESLFPAEIRDRLFKGDDENTDGHNDKSDLDPAKHSPRKSLATVQEGQKFRLKNFLEDEEEAMGNSHRENGAMKDSKPIADLFPNTTVLFADIAGFTAWSSVREPSQVFTLLETVFKAFDKTAKKRKVFKVETVGDSYVAVTGLPEPLVDHAVVMCKFARECNAQFGVLVRHLEVILGPDTGDLAIRIGLHSGPVTAGVLRGDKSRFQLFGDTMNTAARIESTSIKNKIHLSHETAELLHAAGKSSWIVKRTETVMAKGKGEMQTYWLLTEQERGSGHVIEDGPKAAGLLPIVKANAPRLAMGGVDLSDPESTLPPRIKRLVDWNVDVLTRLLKQIVARRRALGKEQMDPNHPMMMKTEVNIGCDTYVLDEVEEIIRLPGYTHTQRMEDPNKIELPKEVLSQLRLYVASVAAMHRDNPFHNFEHASHVMMSVSKLLSRIVAPDEVLKGDDEEDEVALSLHDHTYGITSDPLTQFSVVLAALIHDTDHAGVSNAQLVKEKAKIAATFKQKSVAEQNSIVLAWDRLMESRFTALRSHIYGDPDELKRFRQLMVNTVLATDIFDAELQGLRKKRWDTAFHHINEQSDSTPEDNINRKATIVLEHLIQASDVAHTMQHWHIYQKWNERLFAEMTVAFNSGRQGFDPGANWYKGELGFFDNYIIPLAKKLKECGVFGVSSDEYLNYALENRREWASKGEEVVQLYIKKYCTNDDEHQGEGETKKDDQEKK